MNLAGLETASSWSNIAVVVFTFLAAIAAAFALFFGLKAGAAKDAELATFQAKSGTDIAEANARAAEANSMAASAGATAATANERANRLELESEQQRERAAKAEKDLLELRERLKPRKLSSELRTALTDALRSSVSKGRIQVNCVNGDAEACEFATELRACLDAAGWPLEPQGGMLGISGYGLLVMVRNTTAAPAHAGELQRVMQSVGLTVGGQENPQMPQERVILFVGSKR